jgi:hypothetical protein
MLFNLTTRKLFKCSKPECAIRCRKDRGPQFGVSELLALYEPFNGKNACWSNANKDSYRIGLDSESRSMLTNLRCEYSAGSDRCEFTISELEVWEVVFEQ